MGSRGMGASVVTSVPGVGWGKRGSNSESLQCTQSSSFQLAAHQAEGYRAKDYVLLAGVSTEPLPPVLITWWSVALSALECSLQQPCGVIPSARYSSQHVELRRTNEMPSG